MSVFDRLVFLFTNEDARFRVIEHTPEGRSDLVRPLPKALKRLCAQFPSKVTNDMFWLYCRVTGVWI
jgi:hypothetical protein